MTVVAAQRRPNERMEVQTQATELAAYTIQAAGNEHVCPKHHRWSLGARLTDSALAVAYLSPLDHFVKERLRVRHYIRYSDDMVLLSTDREELRRAWREIAAWLSAHGLSLNPKSALHPIAQGVRFLKFRFVLTATGRVLKLLSRGSARRMLRRMKRLKALGRDFAAIEHCYQSWRAHALQGNTNHQQRTLQQWITHNSPQRTRAADAWPSA